MVQMMLVVGGIVAVCLLIGLRLGRKPRAPLVVRVMSFGFSLIVFVLGLYIFGCGLAWFLLDSTFIFTDGGGNLAGLGLLVGPVWIGFGIVFLAAFLAIIRLQIKNQFPEDEATKILSRGKRTFFLLILIVVVAALSMAILGNISWRAQTDMGRHDWTPIIK